MLLVQAAILLFALALVNANQDMIESMDEEKGKRMAACFTEITCTARKTRELRRIYSKCGPEMQADFMEIVRDMYEIPASDCDDFWDSYSDKVCPKSEKERRAFMSTIMMQGGTKMEDCKKSPDNEECRGIESALKEAQMVEQEYTANGVCNNAQKSAEKNMKPPDMMG